MGNPFSAVRPVDFRRPVWTALASLTCLIALGAAAGLIL
tara:strand:+ start:330 stop:446 length:117 start_codon:yes stop_codon:yes gene_type:complete